MDSFFGIGLPELILILLIAGIVMGPERIGRTARWLGKTTTQLQNISHTFIRQLNAEIDAAGEMSELKGAYQDMQDLRRQLDDLKGELTAVTSSAFNDGKKAFEGNRQELKRTIAPPNLVPAETNRGTPEKPNRESSPLILPNRVEVADDPDHERCQRARRCRAKPDIIRASKRAAQTIGLGGCGHSGWHIA